MRTQLLLLYAEVLNIVKVCVHVCMHEKLLQLCPTLWDSSKWMPNWWVDWDSLYSVNALRYIMFPCILSPVYFWVRVGQESSLCTVWKADFKQKPLFCEGHHVYMWYQQRGQRAPNCPHSPLLCFQFIPPVYSFFFLTVDPVDKQWPQGHHQMVDKRLSRHLLLRGTSSSRHSHKPSFSFPQALYGSWTRWLLRLCNWWLLWSSNFSPKPSLPQLLL